MKKTMIILALISNIWNMLCVLTNKLECMKHTGLYILILIWHLSSWKEQRCTHNFRNFSSWRYSSNCVEFWVHSGVRANITIMLSIVRWCDPWEWVSIRNMNKEEGIHECCRCPCCEICACSYPGNGQLVHMYKGICQLHIAKVLAETGWVSIKYLGA